MAPEAVVRVDPTSVAAVVIQPVVGVHVGTERTGVLRLRTVGSYDDGRATARHR